MRQRRTRIDNMENRAAADGTVAKREREKITKAQKKRQQAPPPAEA